MSMSISATSSAAVATGARTGATGEVKGKAGSAEEEFLKIARMTPAERLHAAMLAKLGLTEEEFAKLDPKQQAAIQEKIAAEIKQQMAASGDKRVGMIADITV